MNKGLQRLAARYADKIDNFYRDSDGIWVEFKPGWSLWAPGEVHGIHEMTTREVAQAMTEIVPCDCDSCKELLAGEVR